MAKQAVLGSPRDFCGYSKARWLASEAHRSPRRETALRLLRERHEELAIVTRDGDWVGIVSVEDLIEQIVGELEDEFD